jgi:hypothetical protein
LLSQVLFNILAIYGVTRTGELNKQAGASNLRDEDQVRYIYVTPLVVW